MTTRVATMLMRTAMKEVMSMGIFINWLRAYRLRVSEYRDTDDHRLASHYKPFNNRPTAWEIIRLESFHDMSLVIIGMGNVSTSSKYAKQRKNVCAL